MALRFGAATSDRVNFGNPGNLTEASVVSWIGWARITTFTPSRRLFSKNGQDGNGGPYLQLTGTAELQAIFPKSLANATAISNTLNLALNTWYCFGFLYDPADTQPRIYSGTLTTPMTEAGYAAGATNGSGVSASTVNLIVGNHGNASPVSALQGEIARCFYAERKPPLSEMINWQTTGSWTGANPKLCSNLGLNGTGIQVDVSGRNNHGYVTGAQAVSNEPLRFYNNQLPQVLKRNLYGSALAESVHADALQQGEQPNFTTWLRNRQFAVSIPSFTIDLAQLTQPEQVSPDRWNPLMSEPRRDRRREQYLAPSLAIDPAQLTQAERASLDKWVPRPNEPRWDIQRRQWTYPSLAIDPWLLTQPETASIDKWGQPLSEPRWDAARRQWIYPPWAIDPSLLTQVERTQLDKWFSPTEQPPRSVQRTQHLNLWFSSDAQLFTVPGAETITTDKWGLPTEQPPRDVRRTQYFGSWFVADAQLFTVPSAGETITMDKWWRPLEVPGPRRFFGAYDPVADIRSTTERYFVFPSAPQQIISTSAVAVEWVTGLNVADGGRDWTNPDGATGIGGVIAFITLTRGITQSNYLLVKTAAFKSANSIPTNATITGIQIDLLRGTTDVAEEAGVIQTLKAVLTKDGGATWTDPSATAGLPDVWTDTYPAMAYHTYGGATENWGTTWTRAEILATGFGFGLEAQYTGIDTGNAFVDFARLTVYYTFDDFAEVPHADVWSVASNEPYLVQKRGQHLYPAHVIDAKQLTQPEALHADWIPPTNQPPRTVKRAPHLYMSFGADTQLFAVPTPPVLAKGDPNLVLGYESTKISGGTTITIGGIG